MEKRIISVLAAIILTANLLVMPTFAVSPFEAASKMGGDKYTSNLNYGTHIVQSDKYVFMVLGSGNKFFVGDSTIHIYEKPNAQHTDYKYVTELKLDTTNANYDMNVRDIWVHNERLYVTWNNYKANKSAPGSIYDSARKSATIYSYDVSSIAQGATLTGTAIKSTARLQETFKPYNRGGFAYVDTDTNRMYLATFGPASGGYTQRTGASSNNGALANSKVSDIWMKYNVYDLNSVTNGTPSSNVILTSADPDLTAATVDTGSLDAVQAYVKDGYMYEVLQDNGGMNIGLELEVGSPIEHSQDRNSVRIYNVSENKTVTLSTVLKGTYKTNTEGSHVFKDIAVSGNWMYLATANGIETVDVSAAKAADASNAALTITETILPGKDINGLEIFGGKMYVGTDDGMNVYNVSAGKADLMASYPYYGGFVDFDVNTDENMLYALAAKQNGGMVVVDMDSLNDPSYAVQPITKMISDANKQVGDVVYETNVPDNSNRSLDYWCMGQDKYISFKFSIPVAGVYKISGIGGAGTSSAPGTATATLTIDDKEFARTFSATKNFKDEVNIEWGEYAFTQPGDYVLKVTKTAGATMTLRSVTVDYRTALEPTDSFEYSIKRAASEYSTLPQGNTFDVTTDTTLVLAPGEKMTWSITPAYDGHYDLSFTMSGNGTPYVGYADKEAIGGDDATGDGTAATLTSHFCESTTMMAGRKYAIALENASRSGNLLVSGMELARTSGFENEVIITNLDIETADGVRIPYAVVDGGEAYAAVTMKEYGNADDNYLLIVGQYDATGKKLVEVELLDFDATSLTDGQSKRFKSGALTYSGNGGVVKAFILDKDTLAPLQKVAVYEDDMIFTEDDIDFDKKVNYENAITVLDAAGATYDNSTGLYNTDNYATCTIEPIFYDSVVGTQEKVYAYLGIPTSATKENPAPAIVLIHGAGKGGAWREWVKDWCDRGYVAISIDLYGCGPEAVDEGVASVSGRKPHPFAGIAPWGDDGEAFQAVKENAGMYQNVINVVNAHNLLESLDCVDNSRTGIHGYSNGGVTTTVAMGVDDRFEFAMPIYGGGYLDYTRSYMKESAFHNFNGTSIKWDPANFAARAKMPVLYINGDYDSAFSIDTTSFTYAVTPNAYLSIRNGLTHSGAATRNVEQLAAFADAICKEGNANPYVRISGEKAENGYLTAKLDNLEGSFDAVQVYYITTDEIPYRYQNNPQTPWIESSIKDYTIENGELKIQLPSGATYCYAALKYVDGTDTRTFDEISVSTKVIKVN